MIGKNVFIAAEKKFTCANVRAANGQDIALSIVKVLIGLNIKTCAGLIIPCTNVFNAEQKHVLCPGVLAANGQGIALPNVKRNIGPRIRACVLARERHACREVNLLGESSTIPLHR